MAKKVAYLGMFTALGIVLGWLESLVPLSIGIPGIKIGLANIVTLLVLYRFSWKEAAVVNLLRILLSGLLFGNLSLVLYSLAGATLSLLLMGMLKKSDKFSAIGVSIAGGVMHNVGQLLMAIVLMSTTVIVYYLPVLLLAGMITGAFVGILGVLLHRHLPMEIG